MQISKFQRWEATRISKIEFCMQLFYWKKFSPARVVIIPGEHQIHYLTIQDFLNFLNHNFNFCYSAKLVFLLPSAHTPSWLNSYKCIYFNPLYCLFSVRSILTLLWKLESILFQCKMNDNTKQIHFLCHILDCFEFCLKQRRKWGRSVVDATIYFSAFLQWSGVAAVPSFPMSPRSWELDNTTWEVEICPFESFDSHSLHENPCPQSTSIERANVDTWWGRFLCEYG